MATFFEKAKEAAQAAAKKSGELVETTKLNININSEEDKIQKMYVEIGKKVYEGSKETEVPDEYKEYCAKIDEHKKNIEGFRKKIMEIKNIKPCSNCGAELERNAAFCPKCGSKQEVVVSEQPATRNCPSCGEAVPVGPAFCTKCGTKME